MLEFSTLWEIIHTNKTFFSKLIHVEIFEPIMPSWNLVLGIIVAQILYLRKLTSRAYFNTNLIPIKE